MEPTYYNFYTQIVANWWDRQRFVAHWWRFYKNDPFWVPPYYPLLKQSLNPNRNPHLARLKPFPLYIEALARYPRIKDPQLLTWGYNFEKPVAMAMALIDPRRQDRAAYLTLLRVANSPDCLERLLEAMTDVLRAKGVTKLIGPTGLSPHLGSGLLQDYWSEIPPLHTAYNPPYLPDVVNSVFRARSTGRLYEIKVSALQPVWSLPGVEWVPLPPHRLAADLLPLFKAAGLPWLNFAAPDPLEAQFLLGWLAHWPLIGWLAQVKGQPVGFVLLQPDLAPRLRWANGGRHPLWRWWLKWAGRQPVTAGRILYLTVLPEWRGQGIGHNLVYRALAVAQEQGWRSLTIGPVPVTVRAAEFLTRLGAEAKQSYVLYERDL